MPWFKNYEGVITELGDGFVCYGKYKIVDDKTIEITELPIKKWTRDYKNSLEEITEGYIPNKDTKSKDSKSKDLKSKDKKKKLNASKSKKKKMRTSSLIKVLTKKTETEVIKILKLASSIPKSQYVCFDSHNKLKRYDDVDEIIDEYYKARLELYEKRKTYQIEEYKRELHLLANKVQFITEVIQGDINIFNQKKRLLIDLLQAKGYTKGSELKSKESEKDKLLAQLEEVEVKSTEYDYLLGMPLWSLTAEKVEELEKQKLQKENELFELFNLNEAEMWEKDLKEFLTVLDEIEEKEKLDNVQIEEESKLKRRVIKNTTSIKSMAKERTYKQMPLDVKRTIINA